MVTNILKHDIYQGLNLFLVAVCSAIAIDTITCFVLYKYEKIKQDFHFTYA